MSPSKKKKKKREREKGMLGWRRWIAEGEDERDNWDERERGIKKIIKPYATAIRTVPNMWGYCSLLQKLWDLKHLIFGIFLVFGVPNIWHLAHLAHLVWMLNVAFFNIQCILLAIKRVFKFFS